MAVRTIQATKARSSLKVLNGVETHPQPLAREARSCRRMRWITAEKDDEAIAGLGPPSYARCVQLLAMPNPPKTMTPKRVPTDYACVKTTDGRIARFRIYNWHATYKPDSFVDVLVDVETRVWNP